jgi:hypothetical protein
MKTLLLMSVVFALLMIPAITSRHRNPRRGVKRMLLYLVVFNLAYVAYLTLLHPVLFVPKW